MKDRAVCRTCIGSYGPDTGCRNCGPYLPPSKCRDNNSIWLRPLPLLSFPIHYSRTLVPFYSSKPSVNAELTERMLHEKIKDRLNAVQNFLSKIPKTIILFRGVTSCGVVESYQCCGGICLVHLEVRRVHTLLLKDGGTRFQRSVCIHLPEYTVLQPRRQ